MSLEKIEELLDGPEAEITFIVGKIEVLVPYVLKNTPEKDYRIDSFS